MFKRSVAASKSRRRLPRRYPGGQWLPQPSSLPPHRHQDCKRPRNLQPPSGRIILRSFSNAPKTDFQTLYGSLPARAALKKYGATKPLYMLVHLLPFKTVISPSDRQHPQWTLLLHSLLMYPRQFFRAPHRQYNVRSPSV